MLFVYLFIDTNKVVMEYFEWKMPEAQQSRHNRR